MEESPDPDFDHFDPDWRSAPVWAREEVREGEEAEENDSLGV